MKPRKRLGRGLSDIRDVVDGNGAGLISFLRDHPHIKVARQFVADPEFTGGKPAFHPIEYPAGYIPYEDDEQAEVVRWLRQQRPDIPFFAVPNGARTAWKTANKLKSTGLSSGVPDLVFPIARGGFHGFFCEMKRRKGGTVKAAQKAWHKRLENEGYCVNVAKGADEAKAGILAYLACGPFTMGPPGPFVFETRPTL